jgi:hypothetical protein
LKAQLIFMASVVAAVVGGSLTWLGMSGGADGF